MYLGKNWWLRYQGERGRKKAKSRSKAFIMSASFNFEPTGHRQRMTKACLLVWNRWRSGSEQIVKCSIGARSWSVSNFWAEGACIWFILAFWQRHCHFLVISRNCLPEPYSPILKSTSHLATCTFSHGLHARTNRPHLSFERSSKTYSLLILTRSKEMRKVASAVLLSALLLTRRRHTSNIIKTIMQMRPNFF